jgi:hypothetical protein
MKRGVAKNDAASIFLLGYIINYYYGSVESATGSCKSQQKFTPGQPSLVKVWHIMNWLTFIVKGEI